MRPYFYQANFCAECGNPLPGQKLRWGSHYFCAVCAQQHSQRSPFFRWLLPLALILATIGWVFVEPDSAPPTIPPAPAISALQATAQPLPASLTAPPAPPAANAFCGARTKRGKACRRLVQPGQRCPQHRGQASLLEMKKAL